MIKTQERKQGFWEQVTSFNKQADSIEQVAVTILMLLVSVIKAIGYPVSLVMASFVEHHRINMFVIAFMDSGTASLASWFFIILLVLIPINKVFDRERKGLLDFEHKRTYSYHGITLIRFFRWFRFFTGFWGSGKFWIFEWNDLEQEEELDEVTTQMERLEVLLIATATLLSGFQSFQSIEGLVTSGTSEYWYISLARIFTDTPLDLFMPALGATLFTFVVTYSMTVISTAIAMTIAESRYKRTIKEEIKLKELEEANVYTILESSILGTFWTNLQSLEGIEINEDKVDTTENKFRFFDSNLGIWSKEFSSKTGLKNYITKSIEIRSEKQ